MKCDRFGLLFHTVKVSNCYSHHHDIITVKLLSEKFEYLPNRKVIQLLGHYANLVCRMTENMRAVISEC